VHLYDAANTIASRIQLAGRRPRPKRISNVVKPLQSHSPPAIHPSMSLKPNTYLEEVPHDYVGRCARCYMRQEKCICAHIPTLENKTRLTVIMHHRESYKTTNTARLAHLSLANSQIVLRGLPHQPIDFAPIWNSEKEEPLFLTLSERSEVLTPALLENIHKPVHLIVPDGNWRQATKMGKREKALQDVRWVKLPPGAPSRYRLRHEHLEEGMATLEAIARALGIIEGSHLQVPLEQIFELMVERTLETRPSNRKL
jgi:DTW domain-containing protein